MFPSRGENLPGFGGIGVSWGESYGVSRNERTGRWTLHIHYVDEEGSGIGTEHYATTADIAARFCEPGWSHDLISPLLAFTEPAIVELSREIARFRR